MRIALAEAQAAADRGETPVGAVVVDPATGEVVAAAGNAPIGDCDPTAHAEIRALRAAALKRGNYRLTGLTLYVTLEPCPMCAGAIILSRIPEVHFGASDPKAGACGSLLNLLDDTRFNHQPALHKGLMADQCGGLLTSFFRSIRDGSRARRN